MSDPVPKDAALVELYTNSKKEPAASVIRLHYELSIGQLQETANRMQMVVSMMGRRFFLFTISGFSDDPRDIWDIPEAREFAKRAISTTLPCWLHTVGGFRTTPPLEERAPPTELEKDLRPKMFGAAELWVLANFERVGDTDKPHRGISLILRGPAIGELEDFLRQIVRQSKKLSGELATDVDPLAN